jgi:hypothetical protein
MTLLRVVKVKRSREIKTELEYGVAATLYGPIRLATRSRQRDALDKLIATHALAIGVRWLRVMRAARGAWRKGPRMRPPGA